MNLAIDAKKQSVGVSATSMMVYGRSDLLAVNNHTAKRSSPGDLSYTNASDGRGLVVTAKIRRGMSTAHAHVTRLIYRTMRLQSRHNAPRTPMRVEWTA